MLLVNTFEFRQAGEVCRYALRIIHRSRFIYYNSYSCIGTAALASFTYVAIS